jgi:hypothetical protein
MLTDNLIFWIFLLVIILILIFLPNKKKKERFHKNTKKINKNKILRNIPNLINHFLL